MQLPYGVFVALVIGVCAAIQVSLLGSMSRQRGAVEAAWISILGTVFLIAVIFTVQSVRGVTFELPALFNSWLTYGLLALLSGTFVAVAVAGLPPYFAVTGFFAAPLIFGAAFLVPRLGVGLFLAAVIAGQLLGGLVIDQVGAFGTVSRPIDALKLAGVAALLIAVVLIRGTR